MSQAMDFLPTPIQIEKPLLIRESHLDTFGHVNNAKYLEIFEEARWDFIESRGYGLQRIRELKTGPVILEVNLKFVRELRLRENVVIRSVSDAYNGGKIMTMRQEIINQKGELACAAQFTFGLFSLVERKLIQPTPEWCRAVGLLA